jgi:peptidoglycan/xylan/chitin deacetylase (PgdA/CDA1 family)
MRKSNLRKKTKKINRIKRQYKTRRLLVPFIVGMFVLIIGWFCAVQASQSESKKIQLAILCYHHVDLHQKTPYSVTSERFIAQLTALRNAGYTFVSLAQIENFIVHGNSLPQKSVAVTFDDGNISSYRVVYPLLKKMGIPWALFVYPTVTNAGHAKYCASWAEVKTMADDGVTIGSHSYTHPFLTMPPFDVTTPEQYRQWLNLQLVDSKKYIENKIGRSVAYFAVPFGAFDQTVYEAIKGSGYALSFNVHGMNNTVESDPFNLNRIIVLANTSPADLVAFVSARPLFFSDRYPQDLSRITDNRPDVDFSIKDIDQYQAKTIQLKVSGFKGVYLTHQKNNLDFFDERITLARQGFYIASVTCLDNFGNLCRGTWLFKYDRRTPSFLVK